MNEEDIILPEVDLDTSVNVELPMENVTFSEVVEHITVDEQEEVVIDVSEVFGVVRGYEEGSNHQHRMEQISNLEHTLNILGIPHEVYSQNGGYAEFRQWADSNTQSEYRIGYFVSLINKDGNNYIDICKEQTEDVYGVTVTSSGFCGHQYDTYNLLDNSKPNKANSNEPYEKVCLLGTVMARVHSQANFEAINIGDFVIPDQYGCAIKSENNIGFKVIMKEAAGVGESTWNKVAIALVPQNDNVSRVMKALGDTNNNLDDIKVQLGDLNEKVDSNISISGKFEDLEEAFGKLESNVDVKLETAETTLSEAKNISSEAKEKMSEMTTNYTEAMNQSNMAISKANEALGQINDYDLETIAEYKDNIASFFSTADEDEISIGTILRTKGNVSMLQQASKEFQHLICHVDTYSVGNQSPTYGLSCDEAEGMLDVYEYVYVPINNHTEESCVYRCICVIEPEQPYYFIIADNAYSFEESKRYSRAILEYNTKTHQLTIDGESVDVAQVNSIDGAIELDFVSELTIEFKSGKSYKWTYNTTDNKYDYWQEYLPVGFTDTPDDDFELWYTRNGVKNENEYLYNPGTLYRKVASTNENNEDLWVAVAKINDKNARTMSYINQTADSISSTVTNVVGQVSTMEQTVDNFSTTVKDIDGELSQIHQTADNIRLGVYNEGGGSSSLELLLSGLRSDSINAEHAWVCKVLGTQAIATEYYSEPPTWNGSEFSFDGMTPSDDGTYCFASESKQKYYHNIDGGYDVYTCGNTAIASLNTRVTDAEAEVESWTQFKTDVSSTMTKITQNSSADVSELAHIVMGQFLNKVETVSNPTEEQLADLMLDERYNEEPTWGDQKFVFGGDVVINGKYCASIDEKYYYELMIDGDGNIVGYVKYEMKSSNYSSVVQKIEDDKSYIGLVAGNDENMGSIVARTINDKSEVCIEADKISLNGTTTFADTLNPEKTAISGNYIKTGSITSNNYNGPVTYRMYNITIDPENMVLKKSDDSLDCIYWLPYVNGKLSPKNGIYYYCDVVEDGTVLSVDKLETSQYIVSPNAFDLIASDIKVDGTKFDLNVGTIYSKNFSFDADGNLEVVGKITATSGYIGDAEDGFTINRVAGYSIEVADGLQEGMIYYLLDNNIYYYFTSPITLSGPCNVVVNLEGLHAEINNDVMMIRPTLKTSESVPLHPDTQTYYFEMSDRLVYNITDMVGFTISNALTKFFGINYINNDGIKELRYYSFKYASTEYDFKNTLFIPKYKLLLTKHSNFTVLQAYYVSEESASSDHVDSITSYNDPIMSHYANITLETYSSQKLSQFVFNGESYYEADLENLPQLTEADGMILYVPENNGELGQLFYVREDDDISNTDACKLQMSSEALKTPLLTNNISTSNQIESINYAIYNNQTSLYGDEFGDNGVYISKNGIGLGNGRFYVDHKGNVRIISTFNDDGVPQDYTLYNSQGPIRFVNGQRVSTYNMVLSCSNYDGVTGKYSEYGRKSGSYGDQFSTYTSFYCVGEYWYELANKYNEGNYSDEQKRRMLNVSIIDNTVASHTRNHTPASTTWYFERIKPVDVGTSYGHNDSLKSDFRGAIIEYTSQSDFKIQTSESVWDTISTISKLVCIINSTMEF